MWLKMVLSKIFDWNKTFCRAWWSCETFSFSLCWWKSCLVTSAAFWICQQMSFALQEPKLGNRWACAFSLVVTIIKCVTAYHPRRLFVAMSTKWRIPKEKRTIKTCFYGGDVRCQRRHGGTGVRLHLALKFTAISVSEVELMHFINIKMEAVVSYMKTLHKRRAVKSIQL